MKNIKRNLVKVLSVFFVISSVAIVAFAAKALTAQEKLEKGQSLYEAGDYDKAMNYFLDVFVEGNIDQMNIANEYVDMIHFKRGGVSVPVRVNYDENLEAQKEIYKQEARDLQNEINQGYDDALNYTQERVYSSQTKVQNAANKAQDDYNQFKDDFEVTEEEFLAYQKQQEEELANAKQNVKNNLQESKNNLENDLNNAKDNLNNTWQEETTSFEEEWATAKGDFDNDVQTAKEDFDNSVKAAKDDFNNTFAYDEEIIVPADESKYNYDEDYSMEEGSYSADEIVADTPVYDLGKKEQMTDRSISEMQASLVDKLNKVDGVNVYFRNGKIDAIDIDSDVIFLDDKITFSPQGKEVLEDVYKVMLLSKEPVFVLLPPGSYTDEVNLQGVRQAVALNSYLINMGLSSSKLNFNMGLLNEQAPAKFSNLEGISIVFDYDNKPSLYSNVSDKYSYPILSLGMYPDTINPELGQGMVIEFSVVEATAPIDNWKLQIIRHGSDGKYYIVRQLSGQKPVYEQIFWNGKKNFFGANLPAGKYTLMLRAKDADGREKLVRRKVQIVSSVKEEKEEMPAKEAKQAKTAQTTKTSKVAKQGTLDYKTPRLWTKPAKILKKQGAVSQEDMEVSKKVIKEETSNGTTTTETTIEVTKTQSTYSSTQNKVVNPSATPSEDEDLAYDPDLEDLDII